MRIVVVEPDGAGGMIHYAYQLCEALSDQGADVTLITATDYELSHLPHSFDVEPIMRLWPAIESPASQGIVASIGRKIRRAWRGFRYAAAWKTATKRILELRPDVAQFAIIRFPFQAWFLRRLRRAGIILSQVCHEFEPRERSLLGRRMIRASSSMVYQQFSTIFVHGAANRDAFSNAFDIDPEIVIDIPHGDESMFVRLADDGGDLRSHYGIPPDNPVAVFFGGLRPSKGIEDLIRAVSMSDSENLHLIVAGHPAGVDPVHLRSVAASLGIGDRSTVDDRYLPFGQIGPLIRTATTVVLPYRSATASGVLQIAYAFAKPVIVTDVGALPEYVIDGTTGFVVPPEDPAALSAALVKMASDPAEAAHMGEQAATHASTFSWGPIARTVIDRYETLT